jgi:thioesterase domain-containing protein
VILVRAASSSPDPRNGWGSLAADVETHIVAASHQQMMSEPHVGEVAGILRRALKP